MCVVSCLNSLVSKTRAKDREPRYWILPGNGMSEGVCRKILGLPNIVCKTHETEPCLCWLATAFQCLALNTYLLKAVVHKWLC